MSSLAILSDPGRTLSAKLEACGCSFFRKDDEHDIHERSGAEREPATAFTGLLLLRNFFKKYLKSKTPSFTIYNHNMVSENCVH